MNEFMQKYDKKEKHGKIGKGEGKRPDGVEEYIIEYAIEKGGYWNFRSTTDNGEIFYAFIRETVADSKGKQYFRPSLTLVDSTGMSYTIFRNSFWQR